MRSLLIIASMSLLVAYGCASEGPVQQPGAVSEPEDSAVAASVVDVQRDATRFLGQRVRWTGTVLAVRTQRNGTEIELRARPLGAHGTPDPADGADARFLAELGERVDPADYPAGSQLTVIGRLLWVEPRAVGDGSYTYPVVVADSWQRGRPPLQEPFHASRINVSNAWNDPWTDSPYQGSDYPW
jgi:outer membrane lipoprotein